MKKWKTSDLVWPWCMDKFTGTKGDKFSVTENLVARGFPLRELEAKPPGKKLLEVSSSILVRMLNMKEEGIVPWILMLSNAPEMLQAIANLIPVGYSLTVFGSCAVTRTPQIVDMFFSKRPSDMFEPDPAGESLHELKTAGFLSWEGIHEMVSGSPHQYGRFSTLMEYRIRHKLLTLMTATYVYWSGDTQKQIQTQIAAAAGNAVAAMLLEVPVILLKVPIQSPPLKTMEL